MEDSAKIESVTVEILNWEKFNPRGDVKAASWFRVNHSMFFSPEWSGFSAEQMHVWMYLLACVSMGGKKSLKINLKTFHRQCKVSKKLLIDTIYKLEELQCISISDTVRARALRTVRTRRTDETNETGCLAAPAPMEPDTPAVLTVVKSVVDTPARKRRTAHEQASAKRVRDSYCESWQARYGLPPTFAAAEHSLVYQLLARIGPDDAVELARAYPAYPDPFHMGRKHPFGMLVKDLDKIRVELKDPRRMLDHVQVRKQINENADQMGAEMRLKQLEREIAEENNGKLLEGA